jgi:hypothetical protein
MKYTFINVNIGWDRELTYPEVAWAPGSTGKLTGHYLILLNGKQVFEYRHDSTVEKIQADLDSLFLGKLRNQKLETV